ncbi:hypothetical protein OB952_22305 [Aeromonas salmonicida]|uniref:hypothetical protein n=1 Tax=Aeromonas salmonicida TaxID=645 RepID=UPI00259E1242|nr:hypothetical protein [Aeromonas salmonicida]MDM5070064.1 hypothetical protein [Aeromonas salmonicida]
MCKEIIISDLKTREEVTNIITAIAGSADDQYPELIRARTDKYRDDIILFANLIKSATSSPELLEKIRAHVKPTSRMTMLKLFRRCVCSVCDTEATKKKNIPTESFIYSYGHLFRKIDILKTTFQDITDSNIETLSALLGEYDNRGKSGYALTTLFFDAFENILGNDYSIDGPTGAGSDIELRTILKDFQDNCPCDFVIKRKKDNSPAAVGFARYDSTRGGAQSDDRTGGNSDKISKIYAFCFKYNIKLKIIFLSDGPGLAHRDTWEETRKIDRIYGDMVRVTTLKTLSDVIKKEWLD